MMLHVDFQYPQFRMFSNFPTPELLKEAFAVNEIGSSEWSEWSDELETHPFAPGKPRDL